MKKYYETHVMGWLGSALILFGYYLNANMYVSCWAVWLIGNALVGVYCLNKGAYPTAVMSFMLMILNIYGYLNWI